MQKIARPNSAAFHLVLGLSQFVVDKQPFVGAIVVELVERVIDCARRNAQTQMIAGNRFNGVGLIQHGYVVVGQNASAGAAQGQIAEEQRMINNENLRPAGAASRLVVKAGIVRWTASAHAIAAVAGDFVPNGPRRPE